MKISLDTTTDYNNLVKFLKLQSQEKDEILYGLLEKPEEVQKTKQTQDEESTVRYRTDRERLKNGDHICLNCRYWVNNKCTSKKFRENENLWVMECIAEGYAYWENK